MSALLIPSGVLRRVFWSRLIEDSRGCWIFQGSPDGKGYGHIRVGDRGNGEDYRAHRISFALHHGYEPALFVLHKCDVRLCCNPDHLFLGTAADNTHDMIVKGRHGNKLQGTCKNGHDATKRVQRGKRLVCVPCENDAGLRRRQRNLAAGLTGRGTPWRK